MRDEPSHPSAKDDNSEIAAQTLLRPEVGHSNLMTTAAVAAAAEQHIAASEDGNGNDISIDNMQVDHPTMLLCKSDLGMFGPTVPTTNISGMSEDCQLVPQSAFYKIVQEHVWTILSKMPTPPALPLPKDQ